MDLQRVSYTYVQYVHIYNVQQWTNIYIKNNYKNSFLSSSCRDFLACAADLCPRSTVYAFPFTLPMLCPWPVPLSMPPWHLPLIHTPGLCPWPFFFFIQRTICCYSDPGPCIFYIDPIFLFLIQKSLCLCLILLHNSGAISGLQSIFSLIL